MKKAVLVVPKSYLGSAIFNSHSSNADYLAGFRELKKELFLHKIDLQTQDIHSIDQSDWIIYLDMPESLPSSQDIHKSFLIIFESELIRPDNWDLKSHSSFKKVFTWHDDFSGKSNYVKLNMTIPKTSLTKKTAFKDKKLCTLVSGNKRCSRKNELYSKRIEAIKWFEKNHSDDFEFYGVGWDHISFNFNSHQLIKSLNRRFNFLTKLFTPKYKNYKGSVDSKLETLNHYKFSICYENAENIPGYITEKIFDSFQAECIPIYWGAPNIEDYVPKECFIDRQKYKSYEDLYNKIKFMKEDEYNGYLREIRNYLDGPGFYEFSPKCFSKIIIEQLILNSL